MQEKISCVHFPSQNCLSTHRAVPSQPSAAPRITITHRLTPGPIQYQDYGIDLSRRFLPGQVTDHAHQSSDFLRAKTDGQASKGAHPAPPSRPVSQNQPNPTEIINRRLRYGIDEVLGQLADTFREVGGGALAAELEHLREYTWELVEDITSRNDTPPTAAVDAVDNRPKPSPLPVPRLQGPQAGPTGDERKRWSNEETRIMDENQGVSSKRKRPADTQGEGEVEEAQQPQRVFRGRVQPEQGAAEAERDTSPESSELSQLLDKARERIHEWMREDGL